MSMTDPIADFLTRLRNANMRRKESFDAPASKMKLEIARILKEEGFIRHYKFLPEENKQGAIRVYLKFGPTGERVIHEIKRVSKPGRRVYVPTDKIPYVLGGLGISILTTSRGLMTGKRARREKVGGELLCAIN